MVVKLSKFKKKIDIIEYQRNCISNVSLSVIDKVIVIVQETVVGRIGQMIT